jgi:hypothetical protein
MAEERHIIRVPNWVWEYAQEETGKNRPASYLVDVLSEAVAQRMRGVAAEVEAEVEAEEEDRADEEVDQGRVITAEYRTICNACGRLVNAGDRCVIRRNSLGYKDILHLDDECLTKDGSA